MAKYAFDKDVDNELKIFCRSCENYTRHKIVKSVIEDDKEALGYDDWIYWTTKYQIVQCQGCDDISFRTANTNSEDYDDEGRYYETVSIYPKRSIRTWKTKDFLNVPQNLRRIYKETIDCYNNDNLTLCAAGVRSLVEGVCQENGILDGEVEHKKADGSVVKKRVSNLMGKINGLHEKGKLTSKNAETLHEHRFLGNIALHELSSPSKDELGLALEIIEHTFDTLYEIPEKASQLKSRRLKK